MGFLGVWACSWDLEPLHSVVTPLRQGRLHVKVLEDGHGSGVWVFGQDTILYVYCGEQPYKTWGTKSEMRASKV